MAKTIPLLDLMFFLTETKNDPKHVAALIVLERPAGAGRRFVGDLVAAYRKATPAAPFDQVPEFSLVRLPRWVAAPRLDMQYHVRHTTLPEGATQAQLLAHVAHLHAELLDRSRPCFEAHFIDGLPEGRFALYLKMHHAMVDGASAIARIAASLGEAPARRPLPPFFAVDPHPAAGAAAKTRTRALRGLRKLLFTQARAAADVYASVLRKNLTRVRKGRAAGNLPFSGARAATNEGVLSRRAVATLSLPLEEMKAAGRVFGGTLNDVAVTIVDAAINEYLRERGASPAKPLVAMCPVSLRAAGDKEATTKASAIFVPLGAPRMRIDKRLERTVAATSSAKAELGALSNDAAMLYAIAAFGLAEVAARFGKLAPPLANFVLSNVPGARSERYLAGARVLGMYPLSALGAGIGLNVTLLSYADSIDFGFVANGAAMPDLERLAEHADAAFAALERAAASRARARGATAKAVAKSRPLARGGVRKRRRADTGAHARGNGAGR